MTFKVLNNKLQSAQRRSCWFPGSTSSPMLGPAMWEVAPRNMRLYLPPRSYPADFTSVSLSVLWGILGTGRGFPGACNEIKGVMQYSWQSFRSGYFHGFSLLSATPALWRGSGRRRFSRQTLNLINIFLFSKPVWSS